MLQQQNTKPDESRRLSIEEQRRKNFPANWGQEFADNLNRNVLLEAQEDERQRQMLKAN